MLDDQGHGVHLLGGPLEERPVGVVGVLLEVDDVAAVFRDERRGGGDDAPAVGAGDEQSGRGGGWDADSVAPTTAGIAARGFAGGCPAGRAAGPHDRLPAPARPISRWGGWSR